MDIRKYDDPQTSAHCYEVRNNQGEVVLQLCLLTKGYSKPQPLPGFEVWPYVDDADQLGEVTFQADEGEEPWFFEPTDRSRRFLEMSGLWSRTLEGSAPGSLRGGRAPASRGAAEKRSRGGLRRCITSLTPRQSASFPPI